MSTPKEPDTWDRLREPFRVHEIKWRVGSTARSGKSANLLAYIDSRCAFDRFDEVIGPGKWRNKHRQGPLGGVLCTISVLVDGEWVDKEDGADGTQIEATKGGYSDAFKRAAVLWGVGRYLYSLPCPWQPIKEGRSPAGAISVKLKSGGYGYCDRPKLPEWALHSDDKKLKTQPRNRTEPDANKLRQANHDPSWHDNSQGWRMFCENDLESGIGEINDFLTKLKKKRPSNMTEAERTDEAKWLASDEGKERLASYRAWKAKEAAA